MGPKKLGNFNEGLELRKKVKAKVRRLVTGNDDVSDKYPQAETTLN